MTGIDYQIADESRALLERLGLDIDADHVCRIEITAKCVEVEYLDLTSTPQRRVVLSIGSSGVFPEEDR